MQRFIAAGLMGRGTTLIRQPAESDDATAALATAELLGADLGIDPEGNLHITGGKLPPDAPLNVGESGLSMRLFTPIAAMSGFPIQLTGEGSLLRRPIDQFKPVFKALGGEFESSNGCLPVRLKGPLMGGDVHLDGRVSSQFLSGLLMALPLAQNDSVVRVDGLKSTPYIDMTLEVLEQFNVVVTHQHYERFHIPGKQFYTPTEVVCDADWSSAATLLVGAALSGGRSDTITGSEGDGVVIDGMETRYSQADSRITGVLLFAGAKLLNRSGTIHVHAPRLRGFQFDATDSPDLFPILAALASGCEGKSEITGVHRLKHKESDRATAIVNEFAKAGVIVEVEEDLMRVFPSPVKPCTIDSHGDHRIAMAATLLGLRGGPVTIERAEAVNKSYPGFFTDLITLGARLEIA